MIAENLRRMIKANPYLYAVALPVANLVRLIRRPRSVKELCGFRHFCLEVPKIVAEPVFVKIGANDGVTSDPCSDILLADSNWKGLLVEPVPYCFDRLRRHFRDSGRFHLERAAIGARTGQAKFYYVDERARREVPNLPEWFDQLGSFDRNHIVKHLDGVLEPFIVESKVDVYSLSDALMRNRIENVHLLHVDAEGYDYEVLKTLDFDKHAPLSIFIEYKHLSSAERTEMVRFLRARGYSVRDCGTDYFALHKKADRRLQWAARNLHSLN
jgi:FkbM family methyltransferase